MKQQVTIANLEDLERAAREFLEAVGEHRLIAF